MPTKSLPNQKDNVGIEVRHMASGIEINPPGPIIYLSSCQGFLTFMESLSRNEYHSKVPSFHMII